MNDVAATAASEWVASGVTPTYVSATSFTCVGDQTTEFHVGRRLKTTDTGGTDYGYISASVYTTLTTVTVKLDTGSLDSGLSAVSYGINSAANRSAPLDDAAIISPYSPLTPFENLACAQASVATATITADKVVVTATSGRKAVLSTVSLTVNIGSAGANGLDTGAEAASTWYYLWVIWNGATTAGLISVSATAPTMPSGYTHKGLVGAMYNDSGSDFDWMKQINHAVATDRVQVVTAGTATSYTSVSLAAVVPPLAHGVSGHAGARDTGSASSTLNISPSSDAAHRGGALVQNTGGNSTSIFAPYAIMLLTAQTMYYHIAAAADEGNVYVSGWSY